MKLVCLGDSLTFGFKMTRDNTWPKMVEKNLNIQVVNKGICGDTTGGMLSRFSRDVVQQKPTHVIIMGGTNDLIFNVPLSVMQSNFATMIYHAYHYRIHPIVGINIPVVPSIAVNNFSFTDDFEKVNRELKLLRDWILKFSGIMNFRTIDFFYEFYDYTNKVEKKELYIDGVHPTIDGNKIMASLTTETLT